MIKSIHFYKGIGERAQALVEKRNKANKTARKETFNAVCNEALNEYLNRADGGNHDKSD